MLETCSMEFTNELMSYGSKMVATLMSLPPKFLLKDKVIYEKYKILN